MSRIKLVSLGKSFLRNEISVDTFVNDIVIERRNLYGVEEPNESVDLCSNELFIIADCYNPDPDRDTYEVDEVGLRKEVEAILDKYQLKN